MQRYFKEFFNYTIYSGDRRQNRPAESHEKLDSRGAWCWDGKTEGVAADAPDHSWSIDVLVWHFMCHQFPQQHTIWPATSLVFQWLQNHWCFANGFYCNTQLNRSSSRPWLGGIATCCCYVRCKLLLEVKASKSWITLHCVQKKTPTHIFFHISMNDVWI